METPDRHVRVKIAVAVESGGQATSCVVQGVTTEAKAMQAAIRKTMANIVAMAFVEVDVPLIPTVQGQVVKGQRQTDEMTPSDAREWLAT